MRPRGIRRGWISRFWCALISVKSSQKTYFKEFGTSGRKIRAPQKREIQPRRIPPRTRPSERWAPRDVEQLWALRDVERRWAREMLSALRDVERGQWDHNTISFSSHLMSLTFLSCRGFQMGPEATICGEALWHFHSEIFFWW